MLVIFTLGCDSSFISTCDRVPEGLLSINYSAWYKLQLTNNVKVTAEFQNTIGDSDPKTAFQNYHKDCVVQRYFQMPYVTYMNCIIDNIIGHQDQIVKAIQNCKTVIKQQVNSDTVDGTATNTLATNYISEHAFSHPGLEFSDHTAKGGIGKDVCLPESPMETFHSHLTLVNPGPDREPIEMKSTHHYLRITKIIRQTGLPNYRAARTPIRSGLKLGAW